MPLSDKKVLSKEAGILQYLHENHPDKHLVRLYGTASFGSELAIVLEMGDQTVHDLIFNSANPLKPEQFNKIMRQFLDIQYYFQKEGLIQTDVRLENLLYFQLEDQIKLIDHVFIGKAESPEKNAMNTWGHMLFKIQYSMKYKHCLAQPAIALGSFGGIIIQLSHALNFSERNREQIIQDDIYWNPDLSVPAREIICDMLILDSSKRPQVSQLLLLPPTLNDLFPAV